jgi:hypothetical protein
VVLGGYRHHQSSFQSAFGQVNESSLEELCLGIRGAWKLGIDRLIGFLRSHILFVFFFFSPTPQSHEIADEMGWEWGAVRAGVFLLYDGVA